MKSTFSNSSALNEKLVRLAAANNAKWCSIICLANGALGVFEDQVWCSTSDVPKYYPNIVTLQPSCTLHLVESICQVVKGNISIKDSYDCLHLPESKYEKLFDGKWFVAQPKAVVRASYHIVKATRVLNDWESVMSDGLVNGVFNYKVLTHPALRIIAIKTGERITGGCVLTKSNKVVGLTNFFCPAGQQEFYWSTCMSAAHVFAGKGHVVGYLRNNLSDSILITGIMEMGALSVWIMK